MDQLFLECECLFAARKISQKKLFYIIFVSPSFVNKPKVSFSNPFAFRHSTKIIFYQKNSLQTSYAKTSYQIWKLLAVFYVKLFQKEKCNKTIQKKFSNKIDFQKKEQMKKVMKMFEFSFWLKNDWYKIDDNQK